MAVVVNLAGMDKAQCSEDGTSGAFELVVAGIGVEARLATGDFPFVSGGSVPTSSSSSASCPRLLVVVPFREALAELLPLPPPKSMDLLLLCPGLGVEGSSRAKEARDEEEE